MVELAATLFVILVLANLVGFTLHTVGWIPIAIVVGAIVLLILILLFPPQTMVFGAILAAVWYGCKYTQSSSNPPPAGWTAAKAREEWWRERKLGKRIV